MKFPNIRNNIGKIIVVAIAILSLSLGTAQAIPKLQIYIPGATYDEQTETWIINSYEYDLWVIGAHEDVYDIKLALAVPSDEDGTINVTWN
ncbi:MAG: choice-of-anchor N protein, partial [Thermodesulfobacteriota bacterium]|nr:choice-of-anchor N protein [Thermodesulfobacteriota bacterium]